MATIQPERSGEVVVAPEGLTRSFFPRFELSDFFAFCYSLYFHAASSFNDIFAILDENKLKSDGFSGWLKATNELNCHFIFIGIEDLTLMMGL